MDEKNTSGKVVRYVSFCRDAAAALSRRLPVLLLGSDEDEAVKVHLDNHNRQAVVHSRLQPDFRINKIGGYHEQKNYRIL